MGTAFKLGFRNVVGVLLNERYEHGCHWRGLKESLGSFNFPQLFDSIAPAILLTTTVLFFRKIIFVLFMLRDVVKLGVVTSVGLGVLATAGVGVAVAALVAGVVRFYLILFLPVLMLSFLVNCWRNLR